MENFNRFLALACATIMVIFITGCALPTIYSDESKPFPSHNETPIAINFETSTQLKLQASEHWNHAAKDSAFHLANVLRKSHPCIPDGACVKFFVRQDCSDKQCAKGGCHTAFEKIFFNQFISAFVNSGQRVTLDESALHGKIEINIQPIPFSSNRSQYRHAGVKEDLGGGVWAIRDIVKISDPKSFSQDLQHNPSGEWYNLIEQSENGSERKKTFSGLHWDRSIFSSGETPRNEVVISVTAVDTKEEIIARKTSMYYFPVEDLKHFSCQATRKSKIPVLGE